MGALLSDPALKSEATTFARIATAAIYVGASPYVVPAIVFGAALLGVTIAIILLIYFINESKPDVPAGESITVPRRLQQGTSASKANPCPLKASTGKNAAQNERDITWFRQEAKEKYGVDSRNEVNICFVGLSKTGKSSMINAVRNLQPTDQNAAKTGITATTVGLQKYKFSGADSGRIVLWDLAGFGTMKVPAETYFSDYCLCVFDHLILIIGGGMLEADLDLVSKAREWNVPISVVRSQADLCISAYLHDKGNLSPSFSQLSKAAPEVTKIVKEDIYRALKEAKIKEDQKVYFVSSYAQLERKKYPKVDNDELIRDIIIGVVKARYKHSLPALLK